jgi:hypothetical protein
MNKLLAVLAVSVFAAVALAQDVPAVRKGATEVAGFVGTSYGIDEFRIMGGGNIAYAVSRVVMPYAEFTYFPGIGRSVTQSFPQGTVKFQYSVPLADYHVGFHIRIPIKESHIVPYLAAGVGGIHTYSVTTTAKVNFTDGTSLTLGPFTDPAQNAVAGNAGGGFRFYVNEKFGLRIEAKAYKAKDLPVFGKATFGFFYQIR